MSAWKTRGLRGSVLEELINRTNDQYRSKGLALIQKIPTPITPIEIDKEQRHITMAFFEQKSTVDYIGAVQGIPVCFDAKECKTDHFPLANIHEHQIEFMKDFEKQGGISFLLLFFSGNNRYYYMRYSELLTFLERKDTGGLKHFKMEELNEDFYLKEESGAFVPYLEGIQKDLLLRN